MTERALAPNPTCSGCQHRDEVIAALQVQVADFLVTYAAVLEMSEKIKVLIDLLERYSTRIDRVGDDPRSVSSAITI